MSTDNSDSANTKASFQTSKTQAKQEALHKYFLTVLNYF